MKKTAVYVKASSEIQLESRKKFMIDYCTEHGFDVAKIYIENYSKRESFDEMIKAAEQKEFDQILFHDFINHGRKIEGFFRTCIDLAYKGIEITGTKGETHQDLLCQSIMFRSEEMATQE